ncbi:MAG: hypothetical protein HC876_07115 [Chloroflexaceae bacterium]|nr:hypothetical protein [Chloroflexaceae bacterium]
MDGWVSPRFGIRFRLAGGELTLYAPNGERFATYLEVLEQRDQERREKELALARAERLAAQLQALGIEPVA